MDSKNSSDALTAMEGLGFDDASKVCPYLDQLALLAHILSQKEIQSALVQGQRQAQAHSQLLAFTSMCWDKLRHCLPFQSSLLISSTDASLGRQAVASLAARKHASRIA